MNPVVNNQETINTIIEKLSAYESKGFFNDNFKLALEVVQEKLNDVIIISEKNKNINISMETMIKTAIESLIMEEIKRTHNQELQNKFLALYAKMIQKIAQTTAFDIGADVCQELYHHLVIETIKLIYNYNFNSGNAFSSYITIGLRFLAKRYIDKRMNVFFIKASFFEHLRRIDTCIYKYFLYYGEEPSNEELAKITKYSIKVIEEIRRFKKLNYVSLQQSLETNENPINSNSIDGIVADPNQKSIESIVLSRSYPYEIMEILKKILDDEELNLFLVYSMNIHLSLNERARLVKCTRQNFCTKIKDIVAKIRYSEYAIYLTEYLHRPQQGIEVTNSLKAMSIIDAEDKEDFQPYVVTEDDINKMSAFFNSLGYTRYTEQITDEERLIISLRVGIIGGRKFNAKEIVKMTGISKPLCSLVIEKYMKDITILKTESSKKRKIVNRQK